MIRKVLLVSVLTVTYVFVSAQAPPPTPLTNLPKIIPQSPNTAAFKKFGDIPVSYFTGVPDISIPLYTITTDNISVPISVSYHASGIKVADEASRVGLGWSLIAGSSITRTIRGEDDFSHKLGPIFNYHSSSNPAPELTAKGKNFQELYPLLNDDHGLVEAWKSKIYPGTDMSTVYGTVELYDMEPDLYQFNFPGASGKFILKHNKEVILEKKSKLKIEPVGVNVDSWVITAPDGTKYYFEQTESFLDANGTLTYRRAAWHLSKIITPLNNEIIYNYTVQGVPTKTIGNVSEYKSDGTTLSCTNLTDIGYTVTIGGGQEYQVPILNEILFDEGKVSFAYDNNREDLLDSKLNQVTIYSKSGSSYSILKSWEFNYEYFNGSDDVSFNIAVSGLPASQFHKRLKLKSLIEKGVAGTALPPYIFTYDSESSGPSKASFARDHWGYFNGKAGKLHLIPEFTGTNILSSIIGNMDGSRSVNPGTANLFILKSIKYPTGGKTEFVFESNDFDKLNSGSANTGAYGDGAVEVEETMQSKNYSGSVYNQYQPVTGDLPNKLMDLSDIIIVQNPQTLEYTGSNVTMSVFIMYSGNPQTLCPPYGTGANNFNILLCKEDGSPAVAGASEFSPFDYATVNAGGLAQCVGSSGSFVGVQFTNTYYLTPGKYYLRVYINSTINFISNVSVGLNYKHYKQPVIIAPTGEALYKADYGGGLRIKKISDFDQFGKETGIKKFDYTIRDEQNVLHSSGRRMLKPSYSYFEEVVGGGSGCIYGHRLMRVSDSYLPLGGYSGSSVSYDKVTVTYGENGENGKSEYFYFNTANNALTFSDNSSLAPLGTLPPSWPAGWGINESPISNPSPKIPSFAIAFDPRNGNLLKAIDYKNNGGNYQKVKEEVNEYTDLMAGQDIYWWGVNQIPRKLFINNDAISVGGYMYYWGLSSWRKNYPALITTRLELTGKTTTLYDATGSIQSTQQFQYDNSTHLQLLNQQTIDSKNNIQKTEFKYPHDFTTGNATNVYDQMVTRNIITPVIEQKNYKGTQLPQTTKTNYISWSGNTLFLPETVQTQVGEAAQETRLRYHAYDSEGNVLTVSKENDVQKVYVWGYNNSYPVAEVLGITYNNAIGVLDQLIIQNPTTDLELRQELNNIRTSYPSAHVTTYTYKPLVGMTSVTDVNNRTTYYEHDNFGRLSVIRDQNNNVLKRICYNYQGQVEDCGMVFTNVTKSGTFTRNNCSAGATGSTVTYAVAAATYSSNISQADADQQAQNDVNVNGQSYANTNGTCTWYSVQKSGSFTKNDCPAGYSGSTVTYIVSAGVYTSTYSQADADQQAQNAVNNNGQSYANTNGTCTSNCSCSGGAAWRCVNGGCERGVRVNTYAYYSGGSWVCVFHYEWSDGYWSQNYYQNTSTACWQDPNL